MAKSKAVWRDEFYLNLPDQLKDLLNKNTYFKAAFDITVNESGTYSDMLELALYLTIQRSDEMEKALLKYVTTHGAGFLGRDSEINFKPDR